MGQIVDYHGDKQREEEFEAGLGLIRNDNPAQYREFKSFDETNALKEYEEFKEEVANMAEKTNALKGALYTEEGKKAVILENIDKLRQQYITKESERLVKERETIEQLRNSLSSSINSAAYTSPEHAMKIQDLEAQTRSKLAFANHAREVESVLKELVARGETDKTAALFVSKHAYLFAEKASSLASDSDRRASLRHIKTLVDQAEERVTSPSTKVRMEMLKRLENKAQGSAMSKRLIDMNVQTLKKKYR